MRTLIALLDGAVDEPIPALNYKTPLEAARKPFIDRLASSGLVGRVGLHLHTHQFLTDLLAEGGQVPRGVLEALGLGIPLREGMVLYRLSPARIIEGSVKLEYSLSGEDLQELENIVDETLATISDLDPRIYLNGGRGILALNKADFKPTSSSPFEADPLNGLPKPLKDFVREVALKNNGLTILPWGGGVFEKLNIKPRNRSISILSSSPAAHGLAKVLGVKAYRIHSLEGLSSRARELLEDGDVLVHFERPDEESHKNSYMGKVSAIEKVDRLLENLYRETGCRILIVVDHGASSITGKHFEAETPFLYSREPAREISKRFHEGCSGDLVPASKLLDLALDDQIP